MLFKDTEDTSTKIIQEKRNICLKVASVKAQGFSDYFCDQQIVRKLFSIHIRTCTSRRICLPECRSNSHLYCLQSSSSTTDELLAVHMHGV